MLRKIVVVGDKPSSGGAILPDKNAIFTLGDGHKAALIGGPVKCDGCKSTGEIAKAGGPRRINFMGEVALENDIVICKCPQSPTLIASLNHTATYDDEGGAVAAGVVAGAVATAAAGTAAAGTVDASTSTRYDEQIKFLLSSGAALAGVAYTLTLDDGKEIRGTTDADGKTARVETDAPQSISKANLTPEKVYCCAHQAEIAGAGGAEVVEVKLDGVKTNADNVGSSVKVHKIEAKVRDLTAGEIEMAKKVFQNSIDYSKVKVHNGAFMPFTGNNAMTPNGEMYFPEGYYTPDYSLEIDSYKAWFIHEMTHVWQCQLGYVVWWGGIKIQIQGGYRVDPGQRGGSCI